MALVLVDSSAWIHALRTDGDARLRDEVARLTATGEAALCDMVRLELWNGARGGAERQLLRDLERDLECVPTTPAVWSVAVQLASGCRRRGITVPATDLVIAACAEHHQVGLLHADEHFELIASSQS